MFIKKVYQHERGDTIVEVLIAIAVISLVLAGAYVTTNRSLQATRSAEEQGNALKLAESQIEQLKGLAKTNPGVIFGSVPAQFCVNPSLGIDSVGPGTCKFNAEGQINTTTQPIYNIAITRSGTNMFTVTNQWEDVSGRNTDEVTMIYRVYEQ